MTVEIQMNDKPENIVNRLMAAAKNHLQWSESDLTILLTEAAGEIRLLRQKKRALENTPVVMDLEKLDNAQTNT